MSAGGGGHPVLVLARVGMGTLSWSWLRGEGYPCAHPSLPSGKGPGTRIPTPPYPPHPPIPWKGPGTRELAQPPPPPPPGWTNKLKTLPPPPPLLRTRAVIKLQYAIRTGNRFLPFTEIYHFYLKSYFFGR